MRSYRLVLECRCRFYPVSEFNANYDLQIDGNGILATEVRHIFFKEENDELAKEKIESFVEKNIVSAMIIKYNHYRSHRIPDSIVVLELHEITSGINLANRRRNAYRRGSY